MSQFLFLLAFLVAAPPAQAAWNPICDFRRILARFAGQFNTYEDPQDLRRNDRPTALKLAAKEMPPEWLADDRAEGVRYFTAEEKEQSRLYVAKGRLYDSEGMLVNLPVGSLFVMDVRGALYALPPDSGWGIVHHSSFLAGAPVAAAGGIRVRNGIIEKLDNGSGHYAPRKSHLLQVRARLAEQGAELPLNRMFVHGSPKSLADAIDFAAFDKPGAFGSLIPNYDPEDWPAIVAHMQQNPDERVRASAVGLLASNHAHSIDTTVIRGFLEKALSDPEPEVQNEAALALRVWSTMAAPLELYDLTVKVVQGNYSPLAKSEALFTLRRYHGQLRPFELATTTLASDPSLLASSLGSIGQYLQSLRTHPQHGATATVLVSSIRDRLQLIEAGSDKRKADEARWALQELFKQGS